MNASLLSELNDRAGILGDNVRPIGDRPVKWDTSGATVFPRILPHVPETGKVGHDGVGRGRAVQLQRGGAR